MPAAANDPDRSRAVRIGNCSGFYGDRLSALSEMVEGGPLDVVTGDYLAEVTMMVLARTRAKRPGGGYAQTFLRQLEPVARTIAQRKVRIVVNAGGLDPQGLAAATRELFGRLDVDLRVSHLEGDDLTSSIVDLEALGELTNVDTGEPYTTWGHECLTANAYLGGFGIKAALDAGADVVVTGRVADASLVSGVAAWWWGWSPEDLDPLAGAVLAGHVIECGAQATGGNFSGFMDVPDLVHPGFPIAEVSEDGSSAITKHDGTGGAVTVDTVTAQLLYEIGATEYLNPDVVARLDTVRLRQGGTDRVTMTGVRGTPPPPTTKVAITGLGRWRNSTTVVLTGLDIDEKATLIEKTVRSGLQGAGGIDDLRFVRIGRAAEDPDDQMDGSCLLQISVDGDQESCGRRFSSFVVGLALSNFPGIYLTDAPANGSPLGAYWPGLVTQARVPHTVVHSDGTREIIVPPPLATSTHPPGSDATVADQSVGDEPAAGPPVIQPPADDARSDGAPAPTEMVALGRLVNARSGDKGPSANLGIWVGDLDAWRWLKRTLTTERLRELLPEVAGAVIDRYELENLRAVNFVIHDLLDGGATEARRFDKQAKALGEWLRARRVSVPSSLLNAEPRGAGPQRTGKFP